MQLSRRALLVSAGGMGLAWPLMTCAQQRHNAKLSRFGVNLPGPSRDSGYYIDGAQLKAPWVTTASGQQSTAVGLIAADGDEPHDFITENVSAFGMPGGVVNAGGRVRGTTVKAPAHSVTLMMRDHSTVQINLTPAGPGPIKLHVIPTKWRARWDAGERLSPDLLARLKGFGTIRTMDALKINGSLIDTVRPLPTDDTYYSGLPVEALADIANAAGTDMVLNVPHLISDALLIDWITAAHKRLAPRLRILLEPSNEVWNAGFKQSAWAKAQGEAKYPMIDGKPDPYALKKYYGFMAARLSTAIAKVVGQAPAGAPRRIKIMLGWQFISPTSWPIIIASYQAAGGNMALLDSISAAVYPQGLKDPALSQWALGGDFVAANAFLDAWVIARTPYFAKHAAFAKSIGVAFDLYECSIGQLVSAAPVIKDAAVRPTVTAFNIALTHSPEGIARFARLMESFAEVGGRTGNYYSLVGRDSQYGCYAIFSTMQDSTGYPIATYLRKVNATA